MKQNHQHCFPPSPSAVRGRVLKRERNVITVSPFMEKSKTLLLIRVRPGVSERDEYVRPMW
jgi:hypothetical protein